MVSGLFGLLTVVSLALVLVLATIASIYVRRLDNRESLPIGEEVGSATTVIRKVRKHEPMTDDEIAYAKRVVADRGSLGGFAIPGMIFMLGLCTLLK